PLNTDNLKPYTTLDNLGNVDLPLTWKWLRNGVGRSLTVLDKIPRYAITLIGTVKHSCRCETNEVFQVSARRLRRHPGLKQQRHALLRTTLKCEITQRLAHARNPRGRASSND